jgi:hypothetical protein
LAGQQECALPWFLTERCLLRIDSPRAIAGIGSGIARSIRMIQSHSRMTALLSMAALAAILCAGPERASAHGAAQWIADGGYRTPNGSTCCGTTDCHRAEGAVAKRVAEGYVISVTIEGKAYELFTPKAAVFGSIDDAVWYCALPPDYLNGHARCLFLPRTV